MRAIARRHVADPLPEDCNSQRLIFSEADDIPGLILDRYGNHLVMSLGHSAIAAHRADIVQALQAIFPQASLYERSDDNLRTAEGLAPISEWVVAPTSPDTAGPWMLEHGCTFVVDIARGHKTGAYLDLRDARRILAHLSIGRDVLNTFSYTGALSVQCLRNGARQVVSVDRSADALRILTDNFALNSLPSPEVVQGDVFEYLRTLALEGSRKFDLVVLDPPKLAFKRSDCENALRAFKDLALWGMRLLRPGGHLALFSCSQLVGWEELRLALSYAALDAPARATLERSFAQGLDHPIVTHFPQSEYLRGYLVRVESP